MKLQENKNIVVQENVVITTLDQDEFFCEDTSNHHPKDPKDHCDCPLTDEKVWLQIYCAILGSERCIENNSPSEFADKGLEAFRRRFHNC